MQGKLLGELVDWVSLAHRINMGEITRVLETVVLVIYVIIHRAMKYPRNLKHVVLGIQEREPLKGNIEHNVLELAFYTIKLV